MVSMLVLRLPRRFCAVRGAQPGLLGQRVQVRVQGRRVQGAGHEGEFAHACAGVGCRGGVEVGAM